MRSAIIALLAAFSGTLACAQQLLVYKKPDPSTVPFGAQLKRAAVQIELRCKEGDSMLSGGGTGFIVAYLDPRLPKDQYFAYLVTNRHVAECWDEQNHSTDVQFLGIRANLKDGTSAVIPLDPGGWHFSPDNSVDLAVMPVTLGPDLAVSPISTDMFATKDFLSANGIAEGSPILLSGYFYQFSGDRKFQAIVREGILSMIPDEPLKTTTGKPGTVYLCDVHIFGGNSGSPVMVAADWLGVGGYHLLGVVSGYYYENENLDLEVATTVKGAGFANSGVAMVVPSDFLKGLLDEPELKVPRDAFLAHLPPAATPSPKPQ